MATAGEKWVRVEVAPETLHRLLAAGQLCAADLRCLDCESKQCIWRLCLMNCVNNWTSGNVPECLHKGLCRSCGQSLQGVANDSGKPAPVRRNGPGDRIK